jgi:hypothetical protein
MSTRERIDQDFTSAVKAREAFVVSVLRMLRASMKNAEIAKMSELTEDEIIDVVGKEVKQIKDSLESFEKAGRDDLAEKARQELEVLQKYLPEQLSEDALRELVKQAIAELGEVTPADFGKVMSAVMQAAKGKAEGSQVSAIVKEELSHTSS